MGEVSDEFLLAIAGIAATLVGTFIVAVFFYLDSALHRSRGAAGSPLDQYMRAGTRWVLIAYSLPLFVTLALVGADPVWAAVTFVAVAAALMVATVDTTRRIAKKGAKSKSGTLAANEICTSLVVVALAILPWIHGGWIPSRAEYVASLLLALAIGFTSTSAVIMSVFDAERLSAAPEPAMEPHRPATHPRRGRSALSDAVADEDEDAGRSARAHDREPGALERRPDAL